MQWPPPCSCQPWADLSMNPSHTFSMSCLQHTGSLDRKHRLFLPSPLTPNLRLCRTEEVGPAQLQSKPGAPPTTSGQGLEPLLLLKLPLSELCQPETWVPTRLSLCARANTHTRAYTHTWSRPGLDCGLWSPAGSGPCLSSSPLGRGSNPLLLNEPLFFVVVKKDETWQHSAYPFLLLFVENRHFDFKR